ncbi:hypothetical protein FUAX_47280 (plasmid) [Fulvitalea axinellae]|uniref:NADPH-dependent FMN reductase-like domain-containing protein n=1 Tax=Fulvitalea axinellae TaxID=1182444 RepID=A0AAU9DGQ0_9BACT|nr:hypothetical protein FUAX_47280 [Fulvitalea axinellae]
MKKILAFSGSNSSKSINQTLVSIASQVVKNHKVTVIDIRDFPAPIYGEDLEGDSGIPEKIAELRTLMDEHDAFIFSTPEHNGYIPAVAKNTFDWLSRTEGKFFGEKPVLLLSTSPGGYGGANTLNVLKGLAPWWGAEVVGTYSLGSFYDKVTDGKLEEEELSKLTTNINALENALSEKAEA